MPNNKLVIPTPVTQDNSTVIDTPLIPPNVVPTEVELEEIINGGKPAYCHALSSDQRYYICGRKRRVIEKRKFYKRIITKIDRTGEHHAIIRNGRCLSCGSIRCPECRRILGE